MYLKRPANFEVVFLSASSGFKPMSRAVLTIENRMSPSSSSISSLFSLLTASRNSPTSSSSFSSTSSALCQSNPAREARFCTFCARSSAGRSTGIPSRTLSLSFPSRLLCSCHFSITSSAVFASASPKTCGCLETIFSDMARRTPAISNSLFSCAMRA